MTELDQQKIRALRIVRRRIKQKGGYICLRLIDVGKDYPELAIAATLLQAYIGRRLGGTSATITRWLIRMCGISPSTYKDSGARLTATRVAWIDWMIGELER